MTFHVDIVCQYMFRMCSMLNMCVCVSDP